MQVKYCVVCGEPFTPKPLTAQILCGKLVCKQKRQKLMQKKYHDRDQKLKDKSFLSGEVWVLNMETWQWEMETRK